MVQGQSWHRLALLAQHSRLLDPVWLYSIHLIQCGCVLIQCSCTTHLIQWGCVLVQYSCTMVVVAFSSRARVFGEGVCVFRCNRPSALLSEWPGSFTCHCGNTGVERIPNKSRHTKLTVEKKILPLILPGFELAIFGSQVQHSNQQALPVQYTWFSVAVQHTWFSMTVLSQCGSTVLYLMQLYTEPVQLDSKYQLTNSATIQHALIHCGCVLVQCGCAVWIIWCVRTWFNVAVQCTLSSAAVYWASAAGLKVPTN